MSTAVPTDRAEVVLGIPVEVPVQCPAKNSLGYKIDDIEGQQSRDWFSKELGAKQQIELQPTLKSATGQIKAKLIVKPVQDQTLEISEEVDLQTKLGYDVQLKVNSKQIQGHVDLGTRGVGAHWLNPYAAFKSGRSTSAGSWFQSATFGAVFHCNPTPLAYWVRYHTDLSLIPALDGAKQADRPEIEIKQNFVVGWKQLLLGMHETWTFRRGFGRTARVSAALTDPNLYNAFLEVNVLDPVDCTLATAGGWLQVLPQAKVYAQTSRDLRSKERRTTHHRDGTETVTPAWDFSVGVDAAGPSGLGLKLGYFHRQKVASVVSLKLNKYFSGSLLFDKLLERDKQDFAWGAQLKFNS